MLSKRIPNLMDLKNQKHAFMNPGSRVPILRLDLFKIIVKMNLPLSILQSTNNLKATKILES